MTGKLAHGGWLAAAIAWFAANLNLINGVLQTLVLIGTLVGLYFAIRYHHRNTPK